jgi:hypothetical protein
VYESNHRGLKLRGDLEPARMKEIMHLFQYSNILDIDQIVEICVPSHLFPKRVDVEVTLNRCVTYGKLMLNGIGQYVKTEVNN